MATEKIRHKIGDTFNVAGFLPDPQGDGTTGMDLTGVSIRSHVRLGGRIWPLTPLVIDQAQRPGQFQLNGFTDDWPPEEELEWDIQFELGTVRRSTETMVIVTKPDVTVN